MKTVNIRSRLQQIGHVKDGGFEIGGVLYVTYGFDSNVPIDSLPLGAVAIMYYRGCLYSTEVGNICYLPKDKVRAYMYNRTPAYLRKFDSLEALFQTYTNERTKNGLKREFVSTRRLYTGRICIR